MHFFLEGCGRRVFDKTRDAFHDVSEMANTSKEPRRVGQSLRARELSTLMSQHATPIKRKRSHLVKTVHLIRTPRKRRKISVHTRQDGEDDTRYAFRIIASLNTRKIISNEEAKCRREIVAEEKAKSMLAALCVRHRRR